MAMADNRKDLNAVEARQGVATGRVRRVLQVSLALAVMAGMVVYFSFFGF
jgi:hypothetical protein